MCISSYSTASQLLAERLRYLSHNIIAVRYLVRLQGQRQFFLFPLFSNSVYFTSCNAEKSIGHSSNNGYILATQLPVIIHDLESISENVFWNSKSRIFALLFKCMTFTVFDRDSDIFLHIHFSIQRKINLL